MAAIQAHQVWADFIHRISVTSNGKWNEGEVEEEEIERTFLNETYNVCLQWLTFPKLSLLRSTHNLAPRKSEADDKAHIVAADGDGPCVSFQLGVGTSARNLKQDFMTMDISRPWLGWAIRDWDDVGVVVMI